MTSTATDYDTDVIAWANEQARLLRAGLFSQLDIEHIADEIEDVGKSEQREIASRMAVLLAHLLKWEFQPERRGASWRLTIQTQRRNIERALDATPSLKAKLAGTAWWQAVWDDALGIAASETGLGDEFPGACPWTFAQIMDANFWPSAPD